MKLTEESKPKTAFTVGGKNYQYCRMVMGLNDSAQTWQRLLTKVLSDMLFNSAIVYLDDVLVLSKDFSDHYKHLHMLFQKFRDANLRMNGKKCNFGIDHVKYIGHILSKEGIAIDPSKQTSFHLSHATRRLNISVLSWVCFNFIKDSFLNFLSGLRRCAIF